VDPQRRGVELRREGRPVKVAFGTYNDQCKVVWFVNANYKTAVYDVSWVKVDDDHLNGHARPVVIQTHKKGQPPK
jgi:hypothetical protein